MKHLKESGSHKPQIIVLSQAFSANLWFSLHEIGLAGYVLKSEGVDEIANALAEASQQKPYLSPAVAERIQLLHKPLPAAAPHRLSGREWQVAQLISHGLTSKDIADQLGIAVCTIKTHRSNLMRKLDAKNSAAISRWVSTQAPQAL